MKILLFGKNGQVGWELNRSLLPLGEVVALGREDADFSKPDSLRKHVKEINPDIIVNAVAYTTVDKAEENEELANIINGVSPGVLAEEAIKINALLVHYSTDYVFDGTKKSPYVETDEPNPINAYGRTKLAGEQAIQSSGCDYFIFRTSWVYASRGNNFLLTILKLAKEREELSIVADQIGSPTAARLIAETSVLCLYQAMKEKKAGLFTSDLYHLTASGFTSWHGFASEIVSAENKALDLQLKVKNIKKIPTADYPAPANRPMNSQLSLLKLERVFSVNMPNWQQALSLCLEDM
ncbi:MAG: dTDP-4-dehydrorhamnose reductase [Gammaproteobacteria bacterium]|nr:dTDP-4-dehydrorhamnose reductase [Gammaproteobacteria bacterium]